MNGAGQAVAGTENTPAESEQIPFASAARRRRFLTASRVLAVAWGLAIPLSTSLTAALDVLLVVSWMFSGKCREAVALVRHDRVSFLAVLMFSVYGLTLVYTTAPWPHAVDFLLKYRKLLFIPILLTLFDERTTRERGLQLFQAAMVLTLGASYLMWFGILETSHGSANDCAVFKSHITQNLMMAFFAYLLAGRVFGLWSVEKNPAIPEPGDGAAENRSSPQRAMRALSRRFAGWSRWADALLLAAVAWNVVAMVQGRTGHLVLAALIVLLAVQRFGTRGLLYGMLVTLLGAGAAYHGSQNFHDRVNTSVAQVAEFGGGRMQARGRLTQYAVCSRIAYEHPVIGTGIGSVETEYASLVGDRGWKIDAHPENEYLLTLVQSGTIGLVIFLLFLASQVQESLHLQPTWSRVLQGALVTLCVGSLVNPVLLNTTEGHFSIYVVSLCLASRSSPFKRG